MQLQSVIQCITAQWWSLISLFYFSINLPWTECKGGGEGTVYFNLTKQILKLSTLIHEFVNPDIRLLMLYNQVF